MTKTAGTRILHVVIRYPETGNASPAPSGVAAAASTTAAGAFPLVVFAPGFLQCAFAYSDLLTQWASAGYVVAAVNFPSTSCPTYTASANEKDLVNQPGDVKAVIEYLDALSKAGKGLPVGLIDPSRVAVAGQSDGGNTVAAMAANPCCRYLGLRAAIVLAGNEWPFPGPWFTGATPPPMLFVQGSADKTNPPSLSEQLYQADTTGTRYYLNLFGAQHLPPYEGDQQPEPIVSQVTIAFLDQYLQGSGNAVSAMQAAGNKAGVSQLTVDGPLP